MFSFKPTIVIDYLEREKFIILETIEGGMGTVYKLKSNRINVACFGFKTFHTNQSPELFKKECQIWISLGDHPYIAHAVAYGLWQNSPSILSYWYPKSLKKIDFNKWTVNTQLKFIAQLIEGLQYLFSSKGIIHQDIKPANILLDDDNSPRLADFGLAVFAKTPLIELNTINVSEEIFGQTLSFGSICGTPFYMAPELYTGSVPSIKTDIFSLGVTLYEKLTGEHPFIGEDTNFKFKPFIRKSKLNQLISNYGEEIKPIYSLIVNALEINPQLRPNSYEELLVKSNLKRENISYSETPEDIVNEASLLRKQEKYEDALVILDAAMELNPKDPLLLNSLGIIFLSMEKINDALFAWQCAISCLDETSGMYSFNCGKSVYCDPVINIAQQYIKYRKYKTAAEFLEKAHNWILSCINYEADDIKTQFLKWLNKDFTLMVPSFYNEFGWWFLYRGDYKQAYEHLINYYKNRNPDRNSIVWLTLSAYLSGDISKLANKITEYFFSLPSWDLPSSLGACIIASKVSMGYGNKLFDRVLHFEKTNLEKFSIEFGFDISYLKPKMDIIHEKKIINHLYRLSTDKEY